MPRFNLVLSEEMDRQIDQLVAEPETKSTVIRKALAMYLAASRAKHEQGLLVGFFDPKTKEVKQEVIGI
jgi:metal-responsive CopG/Arc/MetJ family transcriptional regulator